MKVKGSKQQCARCQTRQRCNALTLSTQAATSVVWLCERCMNEARETWNKFVGEQSPRTNDAV